MTATATIRVASVLCLVFFAIGCGDDVRSDDPAGGGAGGGAEGGAGGGAEGGAGGGSTSGVCDEFANEEPSGAVTIRVHNQRATSIFTTETCLNPFGIRAGGEELLARPPPLSWTCEEAQQASETPCCDCLEDVPIEIAPGQTWEKNWNGLVWVSREMPDDCYQPNVPPWDCLQGQVPESAALEVVMHLWNISDCSDGFGCLHDPFEAAAGFSYPADSSIDVMVE